jgi:hypothetical protein
MAASSVTGKGHGAGYANKGPHNGRQLYVPLHSPHVLAAGVATMATGTATVTFPTPLADSKVKYIVMLTAQSATTTVARVTTLTDNSDASFASFVITAGTSDVVAWTVINIGPGDANLV